MVPIQIRYNEVLRRTFANVTTAPSQAPTRPPAPPNTIRGSLFDAHRCALEKYHLTENLTRHDQTVTAQLETRLDQNGKELPPYKAEDRSHDNAIAQPAGDQTNREDIRGDEQPAS